MRAGAVERGDDPDELPRAYAELINQALASRPADLTVGIHLCRGNYRSTWFASGGYEPVAEVLFNDLDVDAYFLEFDDERSGDFAPLRFVPEDKVVVLGLVTSKRPELEPYDELAARIEEASAHVPLDRLCLSPQCGFASTMEGNALTEDQQWAKLAHVVDVAAPGLVPVTAVGSGTAGDRRWDDRGRMRPWTVSMTWGACTGSARCPAGPGRSPCTTSGRDV